ncbi:OLC1v1030267C1 [Oldenlandia corymbosa var. corymbosa]|uniref:OLC1v1030267C1 n=1 Tax=Oldenlandia corymbosa var. corymbosa TaxID=529605 RepID=A0AAV1CFQ8_OLDCO|nr:OLC1v1030267C1 [Oldenlandia corymbosa var. corymbosa]
MPEHHKCRRFDNLLWQLYVVSLIAVKSFVIKMGFGYFLVKGLIRLDNSLVTALVERWRLETHTFHFPMGEAIITLQDVEVLLGLRINGNPITGIDSPPASWVPICQEVLGFTPKFKKGPTKL